MMKSKTMETIKTRAKQALRAGAALMLVLALVLGFEAGPLRWRGLGTDAQAAYWSNWGTIGASGTGTTLTGGSYRVNGATTLSNSSAGGAGLTISGTVTIYIPAGTTLTCKGGDGSSYYGGGPGVQLTSNATLILRGGGTLKATGGAGGAAGGGSSGGSASFANPKGVGGYGGAGGRGAGGGGAGIGTAGGSGGSGAGATSSYNTGSSGSAAGSYDGNSGSNGNSSGAAGTLYVMDSVSVSASGGSGGSPSYSGGGSSGSLANDQGSGWGSNHFWGRGGGGGAGGGGGTGAGIGSGGSGGPGGGSGGSGGHAIDNVSEGWNAPANYPNGAGGNGGAGVGGTGNSGSGSRQRNGGYAGASGGVPAAGGTGTLYWTSSKTYSASASTGTGHGLAAGKSTPGSNTITYNMNDGGDANTNRGSVPTTQKKYTNITDYITEAVPTRSGYTFLGWSRTRTDTAPDATYAGGKAYTQNTSITLYAIWKANTYKLTLNTQGGNTQGTPAVWLLYDNGYYANDSLSTALSSAAFTAPTRVGYDFGGYYTNTGGGGSRIIDANGNVPAGTTTRPVSSNSSLHAKWDPYPYTIKLYNNFSDTDNSLFNGPTGETRYYGASYQWPNSSIATSKPGYTLVGWATDRAGTNLAAPGTSYSSLTTEKNGVVSFYAIWEITTHTITYAPAGGASESDGDATYDYDTTSVTLQSAPTRADYYFSGWRVTTPAYAGSGFERDTLYQSGEVVPLENAYGDVTLTAVWKQLEGTEVDASDNDLLIPAGTFQIPSYFETATVTVYVDGAPSRVGRVELYESGQRQYSLAGTGGVYALTKSYTDAADTGVYDVRVDGRETGATVSFEGSASVYFFTASVTTLLDGAPTDVTSVELRTGSDALPMQRSATGSYTLTRQVSAQAGDATVYEVWADGEDTGKTLSFQSGKNSCTLERSTVTLRTRVNGAAADKGAASLVAGGTTLNLAQTATGLYKTDGWASDTVWAIWLDGADTGRTLRFAQGQNTAELDYYSVTVSSTLDGAARGVGTFTLQGPGGTLDMMQVADGVFTSADLPRDAAGAYALLLDSKDTGHEARFLEGANNLSLTYYSITYDNNSADATGKVTDATLYQSGERVSVLPGSNLRHPNKVFLGWNTSSDGTGTDYFPVSGAFPITGKTTLYARWGTSVDGERDTEARWIVAGETGTDGEPLVHFGSLQEALRAAADNDAPVHITVQNSCKVISDATLGRGDTLTINPLDGKNNPLTLTVNPGATLTSSGTLTNGGTIAVGKGLLMGSGALVNTGALQNAGVITGAGSLTNSGSLQNGGATLSIESIDNTGGTLRGGTLAAGSALTGGTLAEDITANGTVKDATVAVGATLTTTAPEQATYLGTIQNGGAILGSMKVGESASAPGTIANSSTGRVGNTTPHSEIDNSFGTICGGTIGGPYNGTDRTEVRGGTIGAPGKATFIDENARIDGADFAGSNKNEGIITDPGTIDGQLENSGDITVGGDTDITGEVTNNPDGQITVEGGGKLTVRDPDGSLVNDGTITIEDGGQLVVEGPGGSLENTGLIENEGTLKGDGTLDNNGLIDNDPHGNAPGGPTGTIGPDTHLDNNDGTVSGGTIAPDTVIEGGTITGEVKNEGTIDGGTIAPGGTVTGGDYTGEVKNEGTIRDPDSIGGELTNEGELSIGPGKTTVVEEGGKIVNEGTLDNDGTLVNNGEVENNGLIDNDGLITSNRPDGQPGHIDNNGLIENENGELENQFIDNEGGEIKGGTIGSGTTVEGGAITGTPVTNNGLIDGSEIAEESLPLLGTGTVKYRVSFIMHDHGAQVPAQSVSPGDKVALPTKPMEADWIFDAWYGDKELAVAWNFTTDTVNSNMMLFASWEDCDHKGSDHQPTCTKDATCSLCGAKLAALGHDYQVSATVAPTCTENGHITYTCTRCPESYTTPNGEATGHTFGSWLRDADGTSETRTCEACGATETRALDGTPLAQTEPKPGEEPEKEPEEEPEILTARPEEKIGELTSEAISETREYRLGDGKIIVTILEHAGQKNLVTVADTEALVNTVLPAEALARVRAGATAEIEVSVQHIYGDIPDADRQLLEEALTEHAEVIEGLQIGMYLDISLRYRVDSESWTTLEEVDDEIVLIIDIPEELLAEGATYFMFRAHKGDATLLSDLDGEAATITIRTHLFSTYALAYTLGEVVDLDKSCPICGVCPHPLGICVFIWLLIAAAAVLAGVLVYRRMRKTKKPHSGGEE